MVYWFFFVVIVLEEMLDCCSPLSKVKKTGTTFAEAICLARCNGLEVVPHNASTTSYDQFIKDLNFVCSSSTHHMIVSFSRKSLSQTGDGHFSPIGFSSF